MAEVSDTMPVTLEAAEKLPIFGGGAHAGELFGELGEVRVAVPQFLPDRRHVRDRLPPRQLVAVVLEGPDEHDRPLVRRDV